jgi:hypothetical protein
MPEITISGILFLPKLANQRKNNSSFKQIIVTVLCIEKTVTT